jgi:hypothetical protein
MEAHRVQSGDLAAHRPSPSILARMSDPILYASSITRITERG